MDPSDGLITPAVLNMSIPEISVSNQQQVVYQEQESSQRERLNTIPTRKVKTSIYREDNISQVNNIDIKMRDNDQMPPEQQNLRARQRVAMKAAKVEIEPDFNAEEAARLKEKQKQQMFGEHQEEEDVLNKMNKYSHNSRNS